MYGHIENGEFKLRNKEKVLSQIKEMKDGSGFWEWKYKDIRTISSNRYYWGAVIFLVRQRLEELGNILTDTDTHEFLKDKFNSKMIVGPGGEVLGEFGLTTTDLSEEQFSFYVSKIREWAGQVLDIYIPYKGERLELDF